MASSITSYVTGCDCSQVFIQGGLLRSDAFELLTSTRRCDCRPPVSQRLLRWHRNGSDYSFLFTVNQMLLAPEEQLHQFCFNFVERIQSPRRIDLPTCFSLARRIRETEDPTELYEHFLWLTRFSNHQRLLLREFARQAKDARERLHVVQKILRIFSFSGLLSAEKLQRRNMDHHMLLAEQENYQMWLLTNYRTASRSSEFFYYKSENELHSIRELEAFRKFDIFANKYLDEQAIFQEFIRHDGALVVRSHVDSVRWKALLRSRLQTWEKLAPLLSQCFQ